MLTKENFKDLIIYILVIGLFILASIILRPVIYSIIYGILLAYIFYPIYRWLLSKTKSKNLSAFLVCASVLIIILSIISLIISTLLKQIGGIYLYLQNLNLVNVIRQTLPEFLSSSELSTTLANSTKSFLSGFLSDFIDKITNLILNSPIILLQLFIVIFVFFFALRDGRKAIEYLKTLSPLKKETHEKFFKHFKDITNSVLVGQVLVGIIQGVFAGIGYFIFGVPNALVLAFLTVIIGIIPLIGPWFIWIPVDIYLFITGRTGAGIGLLIYGLILINWIDAFIRPLIVAKKAKINSAIILIGMVGGLFSFGIIGLIIGPLVLAYILLIMELYREKTLGKSDGILFKEVEPKGFFKQIKL